MNLFPRLLFVPLSAALLAITIPLQVAKAVPLEAENSKIIAQTSSDRQPRALEISIGGIGPAADPQAVSAVRSVIGRAVAEGIIDTYLTYGYGIEGGFSSCIQLSPFQNSQKLRQLRSDLLRIKPNPETTSYSVKAVPACNQQSTSISEQLADTEWRLEELGGAGVIDSPRELTLRFLGTKGIGGQGGCNSYSAQSRIKGNQLSVGPLAATKIGCAAQVLEQESRYFRALENAQRVRLAGRYLLIYTQGFDQPLRFSRLASNS